MTLSSGLARLLWWRPRAIAAQGDGLVIERGGGDERIAWTAVDAVIDAAPVLVQSRGRVLVRLHADDDDADRLIAAIVLCAGLEWVEPRRGWRLPRMAVRPDIARTLRGDRP